MPGPDALLTEAGSPLNGYTDFSEASAIDTGPGLGESAPSISGSDIGANYEFVPGRLVVRFTDGMSKVSRNAALSSVGVAQTEQRLLSGRHVLISVPVGAEDEYAALLSSEPDIEVVEKDALRRIYTHTSPSLPNDPDFSLQWHLDAIQVEQAWDLSTGAGATVAVLDTGVAYANLYSTITGELVFAQAPDLAGASFVAPYDAISNDLIPEDEYGHGTHVTGTIAQRTNNSMGVAGVAHNSAIMPVKVCGVLWCPSSAIANGITWAVDNGADVINMSLGGQFVSQVERDAIAYAESNDVVVVAAAGNGGADMVGDAFISYPAALATVVSVGAVRFDQTRSSYSNYGSAEGGSSHVHLVGPGGDTSVDQNGDTYADGVLQNTYLHMCSLGPTDFTIHAYCFLQGTSMASPHVAGVAGLLRSEYPSISAPQIREVLRCSSLDLGAGGYDSEYGAGLVQAFEAVKDTDSNGVPDCLDPAPTPSPTPTPADVFLFNGAPLRGQSVALGQWKYYYTFVTYVPPGMATLDVKTTNAGADVNLYVRHGAKPTASVYDCRPFLSSGNETCTISSPSAGTWWIGVHGYEAGSYTVTATFALNAPTLTPHRQPDSHPHRQPDCHPHRQPDAHPHRQPDPHPHRHGHGHRNGNGNGHGDAHGHGHRNSHPVSHRPRRNSHSVTARR